jgi:hypothetical protein
MVVQSLVGTQMVVQCLVGTQMVVVAYMMVGTYLVTQLHRYTLNYINLGIDLVGMTLVLSMKLVVRMDFVHMELVVVNRMELVVDSRMEMVVVSQMIGMTYLD